MAPLPCSPVSNSTASESQSFPTSGESDDSLTTPRPGPSNAADRTHANLSTPSVPNFSSSPELAPRLLRKTSKSDFVNEGSRRHPYTYDSSLKPKSGVKTRAPEVPERPRSVNFLPQTASSKPSRQSSYRSHRSMNGRDSPSPHSETRNRGINRTAEEIMESSADESTAFVRKAASGKTHYGALAVAGDGEREDAPPASDGPSQGAGGTRKRKSTSLFPKHSRNTTDARRTSQTSGAEAGGNEHEGWFKSLVEKYGSVELENKGSVARDHLALERTFLAWLRTSLSFASIGIAVTQLFRLNASFSSSEPHALEFTVSQSRLRQIGKPLGATFIGISIIILLLGFHRYFESQHYVIRGKFPASRGTIIIVSFVTGTLIIASLIVVVAVAPAAFEKR